MFLVQLPVILMQGGGCFFSLARLFSRRTRNIPKRVGLLSQRFISAEAARFREERLSIKILHSSFLQKYSYRVFSSTVALMNYLTKPTSQNENPPPKSKLVHQYLSDLY